MTRPQVLPELRLLGVVVLRPNHGPGWVVGEVYPRPRTINGERVMGEELRRPAYLGTLGEALESALGRAEAVCRGVGYPQPALSVLGAIAGLVSPLAEPGVAVRLARTLAGLSQAELARRAGASRTTVKDVEAGRVSPRTATVARLLRACGDP